MRWQDTSDAKGYNRRQNELRHLALKVLFDVFRTSKGKKIAFPPPSSPCNVVPLFELPLENKKHPNFEWRGEGRGCGFLCSLKLPYLSTMSKQFCRRLSESQKWRHILEKMNSAHVFVLACKTPGGFLFAMFNVVMPIWEQLENGDFVIFCA